MTQKATAYVDLDGDGFITSADVSAMLAGKGRATIRNWIKNGNFPRPKKVGRLNLWRKPDLRDWLTQQ